jgi:hypothetical protein
MRPPLSRSVPGTVGDCVQRLNDGFLTDEPKGKEEAFASTTFPLRSSLNPFSTLLSESVSMGTREDHGEQSTGKFYFLRRCTSTAPAVIGTRPQILFNAISEFPSRGIPLLSHIL